LDDSKSDELDLSEAARLFDEQVDDTEILSDIEEPSLESFSLSELDEGAALPEDEQEPDFEALELGPEEDQPLLENVQSGELSALDWQEREQPVADSEAQPEAAAEEVPEVEAEEALELETEEAVAEETPDEEAVEPTPPPFEPGVQEVETPPPDLEAPVDEAEPVAESPVESAATPPDLPPEPVAHTPAEPPPPVDEAALADDLEEIDFFLSMEAFEDAKNLINEAVERYGSQPQLVTRLEQVNSELAEPDVEAKPEPAEAAKEALGSDGTGFFDLAAELQEELFDEVLEVTDNTSQEEIQSVEELFEEFKKGVAEQIDEDDFETHYDLGIAYKEMGLLEESIQEFRIAQEDQSRFMECTAMIGACLIELGRNEDAIRHYEDSLNFESATPDQYIAIRYELALAHEGNGDLEKALDYFREIQSERQGYRDVGARIDALV